MAKNGRNRSARGTVVPKLKETPVDSINVASASVPVSAPPNASNAADARGQAKIRVQRQWPIRPVRTRGSALVLVNTMEAQLREANENLIIASLRAHTMSEASADATLRMAYLAQHDSLTGLPNRLLFTDRLTQAIALADRHKQQMSVLFLDLDRFKHINDSVGHSNGDRLLKSIAERLLACLRKSDTVCRQGGDEFLVLLAEVAHTSDTALVADKILQALNAPYRIDQHDLHVAVSIGIATYPADGDEPETLVKNADFAMYSAKKEGGSKYRFFTSEMNTRAVERQSLENNLRHVLERHELELHYQPQFDLQSGAVVGAEALIRWHHPKRGFVSPTEFLPVAEECGFIVPIGQWVLQHACTQARAWQNAGLRPIRIAVNMSAAELRAKDVVANIGVILAETNLDPRYLEIELTETFLLQHPDSTALVLQALKRMGIRIALDDFGTGYSSLSYLKRFPIDTLKIDQSFIRDIVTDADDASIVSAVIRLGRDLDMGVIAEGVETRNQLDFLRKRRCPEGQGYYFSRPVVGEKFAELLSNDSKTLPLI